MLKNSRFARRPFADAKNAPKCVVFQSAGNQCFIFAGLLIIDKKPTSVVAIDVFCRCDRCSLVLRSDKYGRSKWHVSLCRKPSFASRNRLYGWPAGRFAWLQSANGWARRSKSLAKKVRRFQELFLQLRIWALSHPCSIGYKVGAA